MSRYLVMEPPGFEGRETDRAVILRDGFQVLAFIVPPLWLLWNRLWIEAALVVATMLALTSLGEIEGFGWSGSVLSVLFSLYVGLEGVALKAWALRRRGWTEWGAIEAESLVEAEIRYAVGAADKSNFSVELPWHVAGRPAQRSSHSALGLLSYPGRR